jgi:putative YphP/YqiW family bacilliredoxin
MREQLTRAGAVELRTEGEVDQFIEADHPTAMVVFNSVCGCAAGSARPAIIIALQHELRPAAVATVMAGQDLEATARMRSYWPQIESSSPSIVLLKNGQIINHISRHRIEGRSPDEIAVDLVRCFEEMHSVST